MHNPISHNCTIVSPHKLNSSELHCQGEAQSSQYSELVPEVVTSTGHLYNHLFCKRERRIPKSRIHTTTPTMLYILT